MVPRKLTGKKATFLLTEEARKLLAVLAEKQGINMTAYLEVLIRKEAKDQGVKRD